MNRVQFATPETERAVPDRPAPLEELGPNRKGDRVRCCVRRCPSGDHETREIGEPFYEKFDGVLEYPSLSSPMWWVRDGDQLRFVWTDEFTKI